MERAEGVRLVGRGSRRAGEWTGHDVPDFERTKPPWYEPPPGAVGPAALRGDDPFVMQADGKGWLFVPTGLQDGPLPTHYEPHESPVRNALYGQQGNPTRKVYGRADNPSNPSPPERHGEVFPYVFTTSRLTEHHTAGGMSRQLPYLSELQPEMFVEVSPALARERGLDHLGWAHVVTSRSAIEAGCWSPTGSRRCGWATGTCTRSGCPTTGAVRAWSPASRRTTCSGVALDPNVLIQESKVATCDIRPGRRPRGRELLEFVEGYRRRAGVTPDTGTRLSTVEDG